MKKIISKAFYSLLIFIVLIVCLLTFFLTTTPGLYTTIRLGKLFLPGTLKVHHVTGHLLGEFTIDRLDYQNNDTKITAHKLKANLNVASFKEYRLNINKLYADSLVIKNNNTRKTVNNIKLTGQINPQVSRIDALSFYYLNQKISLQLQANARFPHALKGTLRVNPTKKQNSLSGQIDLKGNLNQLQWTGAFHGPAEGALEGSLKDLSELKQHIKWHDLSWPIDNNQTLNSPNGTIQISGTLPNLFIDLSSQINANQHNQWQVKTKIQGTLPDKWLLSAQLSQINPSTGLHAPIRITGSMEDLHHANLTFTLEPGHYQLPDNNLLPTLEFKGGTLKTVLSPKALSTTGLLTIDSDKKLNIALNLPRFDLSKGISPNQPLTGQLELAFNSLDFLRQLSPEFNKPQGQLTATLKAKGTVSNVTIESQFHLSNASLSLPLLGLTLDAIDLKATGKDKQWEANGTIGSGNKKLFLTGKGPLSTEFKGDIALQGVDFPIANTREYQINASPKLNMKISPHLLDITGSILIPSAHIAPQTFTNSLVLPEDVVYKNNEQSQSSLLNTRMNIAVKLGDEVRLTLKGLQATLNGEVNIQQLPQGPVNATGELSVTEGKYKAYGQDLAIEQGQLLFTGGRLDNPGINLRASKKINNVASAFSGTNTQLDFNTNTAQQGNLGASITVGVEVTGRLTNPKIQLFSNPSSLSQADILSMLVLGRPASQANKAGGQLLLTAISSMNLGKTTNASQLLEQLKQSSGLDFDVQTNTTYNQSTNQFTDSTAFVVGKSLTKKLYLSYNVGLTQSDPNVLTLKYLLSKFFSIQINSSSLSSGIDVLYSKSKENNK